jgi:hypothetical protein
LNSSGAWSTTRSRRDPSIARQWAIAAACEACGVEVEAQLLAASLEEVASSYHQSWSAGTHFHPREGAEMLGRAEAEFVVDSHRELPDLVARIAGSLDAA